MKIIKCPKCGKIPTWVDEYFIGEHMYRIDDAGHIIWDSVDTGETETTLYYEASCSCGHIWKLRGIKNIFRMPNVESDV
jgi:hypothetical protein